VVLVVETSERPLVLLLLGFAFWSLWLVEAPLDVRLFKFVRLQQTARNISPTVQPVVRIRIPIREDPKLLAGSGSGKNGSGQLRIRYEFEVKQL
jgi:hypothetical protein